MDNLIILLDAKKAFDSVEHEYIEECLDKFGAANFIPIFRILYSDLRSDILLNGRIVKGYKICRGVKQGDALSCILFILCMEPLIRNIAENPRITAIHSEHLGQIIPKVYAYADDVNCAIKRSRSGLQALFYEYERLTRRSGLELNADKTEIMKSGSRIEGHNEIFRVNYLNNSYAIAAKEKVKINGILFQANRERLKDENVEAAIGKMDRHFVSWARRGLSTVGRIIIAKTFGISQLIYVMQSFPLNEGHIKKVNAILYKFIWNRHYRAAKAPERIKREITNTPIKLGGLGMLDVAKLDDSLKLRAIGRLLVTNHPALRLVKNKLNLDDYFHPTSLAKMEEVAVKGIDLLGRDRQQLWGAENRRGELKLVKFTNSIKLKNIINIENINP